MSEFKKKTSTYTFWHSPVVLIGLFCLVVVFAYNMIGLIHRQQETAKNKELELQKIDDLRERQTALSADISKLQTDEGKEEIIRDKFQVVKPGEKMVVIVDDHDATPIASDTATDHTFWGFIKRMFHIQ